MGYSFAGPKSHHEVIIEILGNLRADEDSECPAGFQGLEWGLLIETIQDHVFGLQSQIDYLDAKNTMYKTALVDKFGADVLDRFGEPPNGWLRALPDQE